MTQLRAVGLTAPACPSPALGLVTAETEPGIYSVCKEGPIELTYKGFSLTDFHLDGTLQKQVLIQFPYFLSLLQSEFCVF